MARPRKKKSTKPQLEAELRLLRKQRRSGGVALVLREVVKWCGRGFLAYMAFLSIKALAGATTQTDIKIAVDLFESLDLVHILAVLFGVGGIGYGNFERWLRKKNIKRLGPRIKQLEKQLDHRRTSSGLSDGGGTHPLDK